MKWNVLNRRKYIIETMFRDSWRNHVCYYNGTNDTYAEKIEDAAHLTHSELEKIVLEKFSNSGYYYKIVIL